MALNFCTFCRELKPRFINRITNHDFVNLLFGAIPVNGKPFTLSKYSANNLINGRRQVPKIIKDCLCEMDRQNIADYFEKSVVPYIDESERSEVMDVFLSLTADDCIIQEADKSELEKLAETKSFNLFLANTFFCALLTLNANPDLFLHKASALSPWAEMPDYSAYLNRIYDSYSRLHTLLYSDNEKPFYDFYVCNNVTIVPSPTISMIDERTFRLIMFERIENATIKKFAEYSNYIIIQGTGGLGKSMMMRNLLLSSVKNYKDDGMIPVFVPLKDYQEDDTDLFSYVYRKLTDGGKHHEVTQDQFEETLRHSRVQLLLDGYDEIKTNCVDIFEKALKNFRKKYPDNYYIISSRPFEYNSSFRQFLMMDLCPFSKEQSLSLIEKLEFRPDEPSIKEKFMRQLDETFFDTHNEFASNPLLLTIMLMTFEQYAEVPSKMHVFYREAYATLSQKHDASKGAYKRALRTGLSADRFSDYFAEFCARTYRDEKYEMSRDEIVQYFNKLSTRKKSGEANFTAYDFIYDLQHNLCLLYSESGKYHFTHRSFQEYFCALYYSKQKDRMLYQIGQSFDNRNVHSFSDKTFHMLYDMIPEKVEEYIFLPALKDMFDDCNANEGYWTYLVKYVRDFVVTPNRVRCKSDIDNATKILFHNRPFLIDFILRFVTNIPKTSTDIEYPYHKELVTGEYNVYETQKGDITVVPAYVNVQDDPDLCAESTTCHREYEYRFKLDKIAKEKEKYSELVSIFERKDYPTRINYDALKTYYDDLKSHIEKADDDSLDFLG